MSQVEAAAPVSVSTPAETADNVPEVVVERAKLPLVSLMVVPPDPPLMAVTEAPLLEPMATWFTAAVVPMEMALAPVPPWMDTVVPALAVAPVPVEPMAIAWMPAALVPSW